MKSKLYSYSTIIKEIYLDSFGHMNNAAYLLLFEEARWDLLNKNGYGLEMIRSTGLGPTILELQVRFLKELRVRDEIVITTQLISYKDKIARLAQQMVRGNETCCLGEFMIALFSLKERKLVLPTPEWLHAMGIEQEEPNITS